MPPMVPVEQVICALPKRPVKVEFISKHEVHVIISVPGTESTTRLANKIRGQHCGYDREFS